MNPPIPIRACYFCAHFTSELQFVKGIAHKHCYEQWIKNRSTHDKNMIRFNLKKSDA